MDSPLRHFGCGGRILFAHVPAVDEFGNYYEYEQPYCEECLVEIKDWEEEVE